MIGQNSQRVHHFVHIKDFDWSSKKRLDATILNAANQNWTYLYEGSSPDQAKRVAYDWFNAFHCDILSEMKILNLQP
jgi:hypothetical protein